MPAYLTDDEYEQMALGLVAIENRFLNISFHICERKPK